MHFKTVFSTLISILLVTAATAANGQTAGEEDISVLGFIAHQSAVHEWNDTQCARLQDALTEMLAARGFPVRNVAYEFPASLAKADAKELLEQVWTDLSGFDSVRYWIAGSVEIHKGGGSSISLLFLDAKTRSVQRIEPVLSEASDRDAIAAVLPELASDLAAHIERQLGGRD